MKVVPIRELRIPSYFWRKGYPLRCLRNCENEYVDFADPVRVLTLSAEQLDELVLTDPLDCTACGADSWPAGPCPSCGDLDVDRLSIEAATQRVIAWTGNPAPVI